MPQNETLHSVLTLKVLAHQVVALQQAKSLDIAFLYQITLQATPTEFNGYNTKLAREHGHALKPVTKLYTRRRQQVRFIQYSQLTSNCIGLWLMSSEQFGKFIPRLGGMHFLMSYIGIVLVR